MKVNPEQPFQLIYSLFQHEYLGFLLESYVVQLNDKGNLTFTHQNISSKNAEEFKAGLDDNDYVLIKSMDEIQQDAVLNHFNKKKVKPHEFFLRVFDKNNPDKDVQREIDAYLERRRSKIMPLLHGKQLYEMGSDGEPAWMKINVLDERATVLFHFMKNEDNTHYFPTIKLHGEKLLFRERESYIISNEPAYMMVDRNLFTFSKDISGAKIKPFLKKKFILIPSNIEETYYEKFVAPLIATCDVFAKGFSIKTEKYEASPVLTLTEVKSATSPATSLFETNGNGDVSSKVLFEFGHEYGNYHFKADKISEVSVSMEKQSDEYIFHRVARDQEKEISNINLLAEQGLKLRNSRVTLPEASAFDWINQNRILLERQGFQIRQNSNGGKKYFLGERSINISIEEKIDWFDIKALVMFGEFEIPIKTIRKLILAHKNEIKLPNGEIGIIPASWAEEYKDLFVFASESGEDTHLEKHHIALVHTLKERETAKVQVSRKLEKLLDNTTIEDAELPAKFKGKLRPYQKAGYNWMLFLNEFNFGGCLADDMGLGKTVQTLALLQHEKENTEGATNLLIMPTSLIYNWQMEAKRFTPRMKVLIYTGTNRNKDTKRFAKYDLVITSYGIIRIDTEILKEFYFNYIILDESQAIKNPDSIISKSVKELNSRRKLILTGTPIENSTLDLWSQLSFVNPGLLGGKAYFKNEYLIPIEKKGDLDKTERLNALIKPFILRRDKSQVAKDLPEKTVSVKYCDLSEAQREFYEKEKNQYRNQILDTIEKDGLKKSQLILLQGLTKLRQIANHPRMVDPAYEGDSGKLEDIEYMIHNALGKDHNILIFSQFVKHLKIVSDQLDKDKIKYAYLDGSVRDREKVVNEFMNQDDVSIFLISLKAGGLGLNLTKADYVFLLDPWWNPAIESQAIDRAHRIGQKNKVFTYKFIARDTVEEKILKLQESKIKLANNLITVEESFVKSLSKEDIQKILE